MVSHSAIQGVKPVDPAFHVVVVVVAKSVLIQVLSPKQVKHMRGMLTYDFLRHLTDTSLLCHMYCHNLILFGHSSDVTNRKANGQQNREWKMTILRNHYYLGQLVFVFQRSTFE